MSTRPGGHETYRHERAGGEGLMERRPQNCVCCKHELRSPSSALFARSLTFALPWSKASIVASLALLALLAHTEHDGHLGPLSGR